jgi:hypothetical protein
LQKGFDASRTHQHHFGEVFNYSTLKADGFSKGHHSVHQGAGLSFAATPLLVELLTGLLGYGFQICLKFRVSGDFGVAELRIVGV